MGSRDTADKATLDSRTMITEYEEVAVYCVSGDDVRDFADDYDGSNSGDKNKSVTEIAKGYRQSKEANLKALDKAIGMQLARK